MASQHFEKCGIPFFIFLKMILIMIGIWSICLGFWFYKAEPQGFIVIFNSNKTDQDHVARYLLAFGAFVIKAGVIGIIGIVKRQKWFTYAYLTLISALLACSLWIAFSVKVHNIFEKFPDRNVQQEMPYYCNFNEILHNFHYGLNENEPTFYDLEEICMANLQHRADVIFLVIIWVLISIIAMKAVGIVLAIVHLVFYKNPYGRLPSDAPKMIVLRNMDNLKCHKIYPMQIIIK